MLYQNLDLNFAFDINTIVNIKACNVSNSARQLLLLFLASNESINMTKPRPFPVIETPQESKIF